ncbi:MAG: DUF427 domain-containing protein [Terrimesophilobacter sp.]
MPTYRASWNGAVLAESEHTVQVEGNQYFPPESLNREFIADSHTTSRCPWKGSARYYTVTVDGAANPDAAWYYPQPSHAAESIRDHVAFWNGVKVAKVAGSVPEASQPAASWWAKLTGRQ